MALKTLRFAKGFTVALGNKRAQAATMVIAPGDCEGGPDNRHRGADQWLFVLSGKGTAIVGRKKHELRTNALLLIEKGTTHEIRNTGRTPLKTLNIYVPPAYTKSGNELPRGKNWRSHARSRRLKAASRQQVVFSE
jgi:mannose-6-phosphate isomerase-like protein (cupin superfamily)